jgi:hypothetical protein
MLRQVLGNVGTIRTYLIRSQHGGPEVYARIVGLGMMKIFDVRQGPCRLEVQLQPHGQWHRAERFFLKV